MARKITLTLIIVLGMAATAVMLIRFRKSASMTTGDLGSVSPFTLVDQNGKPFHSAALNGKIWVADFVFTRCMGPCPVLSGRMESLQSEFKDRPDLKFISFSVDPAFDRPAVLRKYAEQFSANADRWRFLTGEKEQVYSVIRGSFHLAVEPNPDGKPKSGEEFIHSLYLALVDKDSKILGYYDGTVAEDMNALRDRLRRLR